MQSRSWKTLLVLVGLALLVSSSGWAGTMDAKKVFVPPVAGTPGDSVPDLIIEANGEVWLDTNGLALSAFSIESEGGNIKFFQPPFQFGGYKREWVTGGIANDFASWGADFAANIMGSPSNANMISLATFNNKVAQGNPYWLSPYDPNYRANTITLGEEIEEPDGTTGYGYGHMDPADYVPGQELRMSFQNVTDLFTNSSVGFLASDLMMKFVTWDFPGENYIDLIDKRDGPAPTNVDPVAGTMPVGTAALVGYGWNKGVLVDSADGQPGLLMTASDADSDDISWRFESSRGLPLPGDAKIVANADGTSARFTWDPQDAFAWDTANQRLNPAAVGTYEISVYITDGQKGEVNAGSFTVSVVPEPSTLLMLLSTAFLGMLLWFRGRK